MKNKKVLIIFKYPRGNWNNNIIAKFSNYYVTKHLYLNELKNNNYIETIKEINKFIKNENIEIIVFDVDYFKFINLFFINNINCKTKILWTGDDLELHEMNAITASACDIVLSACPLSVLKYREKGFESFYLDGENTKLPKDQNDNTERDIDVLFFGDLKSAPYRKEFLDYIVNKGIKLKNVGHDQLKIGLSADELSKLILRSKIVLNLSRTRTTSVKNFTSKNVYKFYYQLKGRVLMAGLHGAACVSEYSPGQEIFFNKEQIFSFYTKEECVEILKKILDDKKLLAQYTKNFTSRVLELSNDKNNFEPIYNSIEKFNYKQVKIVEVPYWYLRISAKQIILRNIKLSTLLKSIFQFNEIFKVIKNTNLLIKFFILLESLFNTFWYSLVFTFKSKK